MIHYTCDGCQRQIDTEHEPRYVLRLEVYIAPETSAEVANGFLDESAGAFPHESAGDLTAGDFTAGDPADNLTAGDFTANNLAADNVDRDHLAEIEDLLESTDAIDSELSFDQGLSALGSDALSHDGSYPNSLAEGYRQLQYDLCPECRKQMLSNPLARLALSKLDFSDN